MSVNEAAARFLLCCCDTSACAPFFLSTLTNPSLACLVVLSLGDHTHTHTVSCAASFAPDRPETEPRFGAQARMAAVELPVSRLCCE